MYKESLISISNGFFLTLEETGCLWVGLHAWEKYRNKGYLTDTCI